MENWQIKPGHNAIDGIKKFQSVPDFKKYNKRVVVNFTGDQLKIINSYCTINNLNRNELFRAAIVEYLNNRNFNLSVQDPDQDPRQIKMF